MKDYNQAFKILANNFFKFKNYRRMHPVLAVIVGILMLPFTIMGLVSLGMSYVYYYFFKLLLLPAEYLMNIIRAEGKEVKHATQAVIYFIGFPVAFMFYTLIALEMIGLHIMYLVTFVYLYFASLCGFKFKPVLRNTDEDIEIEQGPNYNVAIPLVFIIVVLGLIAAFVVTMIFVKPIILSTTMMPLSIHMCIYPIIPLFYLLYVPLAFGGVVKKTPVVEVKPVEDNTNPQQ
ncbi:MAG: hypothetical protein VB015_03930 [Erysipelotrichaceae bacterium]|nr:hypothetical protein [Erysipelotrichaceae bacterium]